MIQRGTPAAIDDELDAVVRGIDRSSAQGTEESWVEAGNTWNPVIEDRRAVGDGAVSFAERTSRRAVGYGAVALAELAAALTWNSTALATKTATLTVSGANG